MKPNEFLFESRVVKSPIFEDAYRAGRMMTESALSAEDIAKIFASIEKSAAAGGKNRTLLGKGADVATSVSKAFAGVKQAISQTGGIRGFDATVDSLQGSIINATGGNNGAVGKALKGYRNFAKEHPIMQNAVYAIFTALAALATGATGGGALAAVVGGMKVADALLQGDKASSAIWRGAKAAGLAYAASALFGGGANSQTAGASGVEGNDVTTSGGMPAGGDVSQVANPNAVPGEAGISQNYDQGPNFNVDADSAQTATSAQMNPGGQGAPDADPDFFGTHYYGQDASIDATGQPIPGGPQMNPGGQGAPDADPDFFGTHYYGQDGGMTQYTVTGNGDANLSAIAKANNVGIRELLDANPDITNPDVLGVGQTINIPAETGTAVYDQGVGTASDTIQKVGSGQYTPSAISTAQAAKAGLRETKNKALWIDRSATVQRWALNESLGRPRGGVQITEAGVTKVLALINEGPIWDKVKSVGNAVGGAIKTAAKKGWHDATNKVTANGLDVNWRRGLGKSIEKDGTVDSEVLVKFLRGEGITDDLIAAAFAELGIPFGNTAQQAGGAGTAQAGAGGVFNDPRALAASFEQFMSSGGSIPSAFRGVLKDILSTALSKVESRKVKGRRI